MTLHDGDIFEHDGNRFRVKFRDDDSGTVPWEREEGHGPVSEWTRRAKRPGERVLSTDAGYHRLYDFAEAVKIARRDGWRVHPEHSTDKPGAIAAEAAEADFQRMRDWCNDRWCYVGISLTLLDDDGDPIDDATASLWGIESDAGDYFEEVARELAGEIVANLTAALDKVPA